MAPIYTSQNVYSSALGILFFMTDKESRERFIINHYFDNFNESFVVANQRKIFGGYYINEYGHNLSKNKLRKLLGMREEDYKLVPEDKVADLIKEARVVQSKNFPTILSSYKVHYLIWDKNKDSNWQINKYEFRPVFEANNIVIYKID